MADILDRMFAWACPTCHKTYEETDPGQLQVRIITHKCPAEFMKQEPKEVKK